MNYIIIKFELSFKDIKQKEAKKDKNEKDGRIFFNIIHYFFCTDKFRKEQTMLTKESMLE